MPRSDPRHVWATDLEVNASGGGYAPRRGLQGTSGECVCPTVDWASPSLTLACVCWPQSPHMQARGVCKQLGHLTHLTHVQSTRGIGEQGVVAECPLPQRAPYRSRCCPGRRCCAPQQPPFSATFSFGHSGLVLANLLLLPGIQSHSCPMWEEQAVCSRRSSVAVCRGPTKC